MKLLSGCSVARLSRLLWEQEVAGSNPATPTTTHKGPSKLKGPFSFDGCKLALSGRQTHYLLSQNRIVKK